MHPTYWLKSILLFIWLAGSLGTSSAQIIEPTFHSPFTNNSFIREIEVQPDGKILVAGWLYSPALRNGQRTQLARLKSDGSIDASFAPGVLGSGDIYALKVLGNGNILVGGYFTAYNNSKVGNIVQLHSDGNVDASFNQGKGLDGYGNYIKDMYVLSSGKILVGGMVSQYNGTACNLLARLNSDGSLDNTFKGTQAYKDRVETIAVQADGKILIGGGVVSSVNTYNSVLLRLDENGALDGSFQLSTTNLPSVNRILVQPDGKILVGGDFDRYSGVTASSILRLNANGSIDNGFVSGTGFRAIYGGVIEYPIPIVADMKLQPDGRIVVCGRFYEYNGTKLDGLVRLNADGTVQQTFQLCESIGRNSTQMYGLSILPDGQILLAGSYADFMDNSGVNAIARLKGNPDTLPAVKAAFDYILQGREVIVQNQSSNAVRYYWDFGTYPTSDLSNPTHTYNYAGTYTIRMYAYNVCNKSQMVTKEVNIVDLKSIYPNVGGNTGTVTVKVAGTGFTASSRISLVQDGKEIKGFNLVRSSDGNFVNATFALYDVTPGVYDLVVTNGSAKQTLKGGFTVQQGEKPEVQASIVGRDVVRTGAPQTYSFVLSNETNVDAKGVIVWIAVPEGTGFEPVNFTMVGRKEDTVTLEDKSPMYFTVDSLFEGPQRSDVLGMIVRNIPAHGTVTYEAKLALKQSGSIHCWASSPMYGSPKSEESRLCQQAIFNNVFLLYETYKRGAAEIVGDVVKASLDCGEAVFDLGTELWFYSNNLYSDDLIEWRKVGHHYEIREYTGERKPISPLNIEEWRQDYALNNGYTISVLPMFGKALWDCFDLVGLKGKGYQMKVAWKKMMKEIGANASGAKKMAHTILRAIEKSVDEKEIDVLRLKEAWDKTMTGLDYLKYIEMARGAFWDAGKCIAWRIKNSMAEKAVSAVASFDPNEKVGPAGSTANRFSRAVSPFNYRIYFENKRTATAPAQEVIIVDTLDVSKFDLRTFELESFKFGNSPQVLIPGGLKAYSHSLVLKRTGKPDLKVRTDARLDTITGVLRFRFISLDPYTGELIDDPLDGFMPPNNLSPEGEGFVAFKVLPKPTLNDGTEIRNKALIYFDNNEPIYTNTYLNKVDKTKPVSRMQPLPVTTSDSIFTINWQGTDNASGVNNYTVYYSVNDGHYRLWKLDVTEDSAVFRGNIDSTYRFFCVAKDHAGNIETMKVAAETFTTVKVSATPLVKFSVASSSVTCRGNSTGSITIKTASRAVFQAVLVLNGDTVRKELHQELRFDNLKAGLYKLCIGNNQSDQQCYEVRISEPADLAVFARTIGQTISLSLQGADEYVVTLNGHTYTTTSGELELSMQEGVNTLSVDTRLACQGSYRRQFNYTGQVQVFPNPANDHVMVRLPEQLTVVNVSVATLDGKTITNRQMAARSGLIRVGLEGLPGGVYILRVLDGKTVHKIKILKK